MRTIAKTSTRKIEDIKAHMKTYKAHTLDSGFRGVDCTPEWAWSRLAFRSAKLVDNGDGTYTIRVHGNEWYRLSA